MSKIFLDTETCGFHGPIVLLQYAEDDGEIILWPVWEKPVAETIALYEYIAQQEIIGFNLAFDWFHIIQQYTTLCLYRDRGGDMDFLDADFYAECEPDARDYGCLRPKVACDIMLLARQTHYQSLMDRNNIYIRKVPRTIAPLLCKWLNENLPFEDIYFERLTDHETQGTWRLQDRKNDDQFQNVYVKFAPSTRLKALAKDALGVEDPLILTDISLPDYWYPLELGFAPYAKAIQGLSAWKKKGKRKFFGKWKGAWPDKIEKHIEYWGYYDKARQYAKDDVDYTRRLYHYFGSPECGDVDSDLACMVGAVRWRGFKVDLDMIQNLKEEAQKSLYHQPGRKTPTAKDAVRRWLADALPEEERASLPEDTEKETLKELMTWEDFPEVARRADLVLRARKAGKEIEVYDKLLIARRFHASFKVIGTLSSRMAGADGLNAQGIKKAKYVRRCFPLAWDDLDLCGGDFGGFEVTIADAVYDEPKLRDELTQIVPCVFCEGTGGSTIIDPCFLTEEGHCEKCGGSGTEHKKIHATFGTFIYEGETYESIRLSDGAKEGDLYGPAKSGLFTWLFAGTAYALKNNLGVPEEQGNKGLRSFENFFPNVGKRRAEAMDKYSPMSQPDGLGTEVYWEEKPEFVETLFGFKRYFTLEYKIMRTLNDLAQNPPAEWRHIKHEVKRGDRVQTAIAAVQSACFAGAFAVQGKIRRVAINHPIQGTGAQVTKKVQHNVWTEHQPVGFAPWRVMPMNVHDEIECPCAPEIKDAVKKTVDRTIEEFREIIPLLEMDWHTGMASWADK